MISTLSPLLLAVILGLLMLVIVEEPIVFGEVLVRADKE